MNRINIHFHGQNLEKSEISKIKAQPSFHLGSAPSDASLCCCISKEAEGLACNLQIHSANGHVFIHRESRELETLLKFIYQSMDNCFEKWRIDPNHFSKKHPMQKYPCKSVSHKTLICPIKSYSNESNVS